MHTSDFIYKGYTHHTSAEDPQYEIKSLKTNQIAAYKARRSLKWIVEKQNIYCWRSNIILSSCLLRYLLFVQHSAC